VKAILAMAKGFDIQVVAEGVEKHDQLNFLGKQGCEYCQGFLLGKPMTEEAFQNYLKDQRAGLESLRFSAVRKPQTSRTS
jgi:sensor c-di-GMP phosphodiesterase-like protein